MEILQARIDSTQLNGWMDAEALQR